MSRFRYAPSNRPMQLTALSLFIRKVIGVMRWVGFSNVWHRFALWLVTPQLMGEAIRFKNLVAGVKQHISVFTFTLNSIWKHENHEYLGVFPLVRVNECNKGRGF